MDKIQKDLLEQVAGIHEIPTGAYSLRVNGKLHGKNSSENIEIVQKTDKPGIDIYVKAGTKNESMHIPVILSQTGLKELVGHTPLQVVMGAITGIIVAIVIAFVYGIF